MEIGQQEKVLGLPERRYIPGSEAIRRGIMAGESIFSLIYLAKGEPAVSCLFLATSAVLNFDLILRGVGLGGLLDKWDRFTPGARRREKFLTPERKELAARVVENICQRTQRYGVEPFSFSIWHLVIVPDQGPESAATAGQKDGLITLETNDIKTDDIFAKTLAHEYYHTLSLRRESRRPGRERYGWRFPKIKKDLSWFQEAIVEKSARITAGDLGRFQFTPSYEERVEILETMCQRLAGPNPADQVFSLFEEAMYGRGNLKPLFVAIKEHYKNVGGIKKFFNLVDKISKLEDQCEKLDRAKKDDEFRKVWKEYNRNVDEFREFASFLPETGKQEKGEKE